MNRPCPTCGDKTPGHCQDCHGTGTSAWDFDLAQAIPCPTCHGTGTVEQENATVRGVPNPVTSSIPGPGPPTSSESPQTLGVTAGEITGTDEGGPGTIEAGQGRFVPNNWPGFAWELDFYGAALLPHQRQGILSAHEATCAQREAQAVLACLSELERELEAKRNVDQATGTGEETNTN